MPDYCVNKNAQSNGDHEVHKQGCSYMPAPENQVPLGSHPSCHGAVARARTVYPTANGCYYCSPECHTG